MDSGFYDRLSQRFERAKYSKNIRNIDTFYVSMYATKSKGDGQVRELTIVSR